MINNGNVTDVFTYHPPADDATRVRYQRIREAGLQLAQTILDTTAPSADQQAAIRKVREAVMTANAAVALESVNM